VLELRPFNAANRPASVQMVFPAAAASQNGQPTLALAPGRPAAQEQVVSASPGSRARSAAQCQKAEKRGLATFSGQLGPQPVASPIPQLQGAQTRKVSPQSSYYQLADQIKTDKPSQAKECR